MGGPSIILNDAPGAPKKPVQDFMLGWSLLAWLGWLFAIVGILNLILIWIPLQVGTPEFEFASVANSLDSMPLPTMGIILALAASRARGSIGGARIATILCCLLAVAVLAALAVFALDVPLALKAILDPMPRLGIKKSITKVSVQGILYPIILGVAAWKANRK